MAEGVPTVPKQDGSSARFEFEVRVVSVRLWSCSLTGAERHPLGPCQHQLCWLELRSAQEQDIIFLFSPLKIGVVDKDPITGHAQTLQ